MGKLRALVVDDSSAMRGLLTELLERRRYAVLAVDNAEDGLEAHQQEPFDLMLVDWTLPGMNGLELCRAVRTQTGTEEVFFLMITGRNDPADLHAVLDAGASDYLAKPLDPEVLGTRLLIAERAIADRARRAAERDDMQARLVFADRMAAVGTLAAGVAHELNNPLMYVLSNLHLTREELDATGEPGWRDRVKQQIDEALQGAARMRAIVRDLKTFSRVDDEVQSRVDVSRVLEASINMCWNQIRHHATLTRDLEPTPEVQINESRLGQVLVNLLINAAQAMPERPIEDNRIVVRTRTDDDGWAVIEVVDNGTGMAPETRSHIFDPFFTTKGVAEGTGLGLSICQSILEAAGGTIEAESTVGQGTTFRVGLPASTQAFAPSTTQTLSIAVPEKRARVAVIDDEVLVGRSIQRALRHHDVTLYPSGKEAIESLVSDGVYDVVFCDLMMPEVSGMEVYRTVLERRPEIAARFVFMTGGAFTRDAREFIESTTLPYLEKPFELSQIRDLVRERAEVAVG